MKYQRTTCFLLTMAAHDIFPGSQVTIAHSLSNGLYGEIHGERVLSNESVYALSRRMHEIATANLPIRAVDVPVREATRIFAAVGRSDLVRLLAHWQAPTIRLHECNGYWDYTAGPLAATTGAVNHFRLLFYLPGFILQTPALEENGIIPAYHEQPKLAETYLESARWRRIIGIPDIGALNQIIAENEALDLILTSEALHEKKLVEIAEAITEQPEIRVILIAGPSASGKTTTAQRLRVHLRVNGLRPIKLSLDNYFLERGQTPIGEDGQPDYEALEALDLDLFNNQLAALIQGQAVQLPVFNFITGQREWGPTLQLAPDQPLIIEGIHGLNERLTANIPKRHKFKLYVSALTQLNLTEHVRIPTRDVRILRRMVRDHQYRGNSPERSLALWPAVQRGEDRYVFPFQEEADIIFNSALPYCLAVLKPYAEPLLHQVAPDSPYKAEAVRLLDLLAHFLPLPETNVPPTSILREFIGGGYFEQ